MKIMLLGLGLIFCVSLLDIHRVHAKNPASSLSKKRVVASEPVQSPNTESPAKPPPAEEDILAQAKALAEKKDYAGVIKILSPSVEKLNREGLFLLAKANSLSKNPDAAIKAYTAALALNPKDVEAKTLIGAEQMQLGKYPQAVTTLKEALEINPRFVAAYKVLIRIYEKKDNKYELRLLYQDLIEKTGERPEYIAKLCELTTTTGLYDLSFNYCRKGINKNPEIPGNHVYYGLALKETGKSDEAEKVLKKVAADFPKSELAQMTYARHLDEQKNYIGSYTFYKQASVLNPKSIPALVGLGNSCMEIQKYSEALEAFQNACKQDKTMMPAFRQATNVLKTMKSSEWLKKFEDGVEACGG